MGIPKNTEEIVYEAVLSGELEIRSDGTIWRTAARRADRWNSGTKTIPCSPRRAENSTGQYLQVRTMILGKRFSAGAARLVWRHLFGKIPDGLTINHKNGIKKDNRPENLELATHSEQTRHAITHLGFNPIKNLTG